MVRARGGGVAKRLDFFDVAWLAMRRRRGSLAEPGWVRVGGVCARSGAALACALYISTLATLETCREGGKQATSKAQTSNANSANRASAADHRIYQPTLHGDNVCLTLRSLRHPLRRPGSVRHRRHGAGVQPRWLPRRGAVEPLVDDHRRSGSHPRRHDVRAHAGCLGACADEGCHRPRGYASVSGAPAPRQLADGRCSGGRTCSRARTEHAGKGSRGTCCRTSVVTLPNSEGVHDDGSDSSSQGHHEACGSMLGPGAGEGPARRPPGSLTTASWRGAYCRAGGV
nr:unnamed protein product [Digitaria exilis]